MKIGEGLIEFWWFFNGVFLEKMKMDVGGVVHGQGDVLGLMESVLKCEGVWGWGLIYRKKAELFRVNHMVSFVLITYFNWLIMPPMIN